MATPKFASGDDLFEYIVANGPVQDPEFVDSLRGDEVAGRIFDYLLHALNTIPDRPLVDLKTVIRENIALVAGDEEDLNLADFIEAPWDCFSEENLKKFGV